MISDVLKISGSCLILLGGLLALLSFFSASPDLNITLHRLNDTSLGAQIAWNELRGVATLEGKRLLLAIFGASFFASGISMLVGGIVMGAIQPNFIGRRIGGE